MDDISEQLDSIVVEKITIKTFNAIKSTLKGKLQEQLKKVIKIIAKLEELKNDFFEDYQGAISNIEKNQYHHIAEVKQKAGESDEEYHQRKIQRQYEKEMLEKQGKNISLGEAKTLKEARENNLKSYQTDESINNFNKKLIILAKNAFIVSNNIRRLMTGHDITYNIEYETDSSIASYNLNEEEFLQLWHISNEVYRDQNHLLEIPAQLEEITLDIGKSQLDDIRKNHKDDVKKLFEKKKDDEILGPPIAQKAFTALKYLVKKKEIRPFEMHEIFENYLTDFEKNDSTFTEEDLKGDWKQNKALRIVRDAVDKYNREGYKKIASLRKVSNNHSDIEWEVNTQSLSSKNMYQGGDRHIINGSIEEDIQLKRVSFIKNKFTSAGLHLDTILNHLYKMRDAFSPLLKENPLNEEQKKIIKAKIATMFSEIRLEDNLTESAEEIILKALQNKDGRTPVLSELNQRINCIL